MRTAAIKDPAIFFKIKHMFARDDKKPKHTAFIFALKKANWSEQFLASNLLEISANTESRMLADFITNYNKQCVLRTQLLKTILLYVETEPEEEECESIYGLVDEVFDWVSQLPDKSSVRDYLIASSMQKITDYMDSCYRCLNHFAEGLALNLAQEQLAEILKENKTSIVNLAAISINLKAAI